MQMSITKTYNHSITVDYQTWKYATTLSKTIQVNSAKELQVENDKLWKQVKLLTELDIKKDSDDRAMLLDNLRKHNVVK